MAAEAFRASIDTSDPVIAPAVQPANENDQQSIVYPRRQIGDWRKRAFDIAAAVGLILLLSPLLFLLYVVVRLTSKGPVFYGHERVGRGGATFRCWKFRTMVINGDAVLQRHLAERPDAAEEWQATRKLQDDPRITAIGSTLRTTSLDELPQLMNVLRGEMSLVGPRPVVQDELSYYGPSVAHYLSSRPGITGLWQVSGRNDVSYGTRVQMDCSYCEQWSFGGDVVILAKTFGAVLSSRGTY